MDILRVVDTATGNTTLSIYYSIFPLQFLDQKKGLRSHLIPMLIKKSKAEDLDSLTRIRNVQIRKSTLRFRVARMRFY